MENINQNEIFNINGGGRATLLHNLITKNFTSDHPIACLDITNLKESTIRNLTNKLADNGYISIAHTDFKKKYIQVTKRQ